MAENLNISDAEWDVIKVLWEHGAPMTAGEVVEALSDRTSWAPRTIKTLLARLVKKGAVRCQVQPRDKKYVYRAAVSRQAAARSEVRSFLSRVFDGALVPAVVAFLQESDLSRKDADELRKILDEEQRR